MSGPPALVTTERLRLPLWTADEVADLRAGRRRPHWHPDYPRPADRDLAALWRDGDPWGPRAVLRGTTVLGSIGFYGPPEGEPPEVEVGHGLVDEARGWGFEAEALLGLLAAADTAGVGVRATVAPGDAEGLRTLASCGFTALRGSDEDGRLVMARPVPPLAEQR